MNNPLRVRLACRSVRSMSNIRIMSRAPVKEKLLDTLRRARTTEPYPVWVTWATLARSVYGYSDDRNMVNLRKTASNMPEIDLVRFSGSGRHAGALICMTAEEAWLRQQTLKVMGALNYAADMGAYRKPATEDVVTAFRRGLYDDVRWIDVYKLTLLVNKHCGASFDPSEVSWFSAGLERDRATHRRELLERSARGFGALLRDLYAEEVERRMVTVGPFRLDPVQPPANCPCCLQEMPTGLPAQRSNSSTDQRDSWELA